MGLVDIGHGEVFLCAVTPGGRGNRTHGFTMEENSFAGLRRGLVAVQLKHYSLFSISGRDLILQARLRSG